MKSSKFPSTAQRFPTSSERALTSLDLGLGAVITAAQIVAVARKVTSLTGLRLARPVELDDIRLFKETAQDLEQVEITSFDKRDDAYVSELYSIIVGLNGLKEVLLSPAVMVMPSFVHI